MLRAVTARRALALLALPLAVACRRGGRVGPGDEVVLRYELSADGAVVESDFGGEPVSVVQGAGQIPPGADEALLGMAPGEEKRLELPPEKAFGPRDPARVESTALSRLGKLASGLKPGSKILGFRDGKSETARVIEISGGRAVLDFNSPLAGKTVVYRVRVLSVGPAP
jgi:FKBP-type peptidyl-prolyl cis-trans isomerase SlpA